MKKYFYALMIVFSVLQIGCKNRKPHTNVSDSPTFSNKQFKVTIYITHLLPYCKGVAPQSEEDYRVVVPEANSDFYITKEADSIFKIIFQTDDSGKYSLSLPTGKYCIKRLHKNTDFENFLKSNKKTDTEYISYGDRVCYYEWWSKCEGSFEILEDDITTKEAKIQVRSNCFTGEDPCKFYNGPMPP